MTINPRYTYTDATGREVTVPLSEKKYTQKILKLNTANLIYVLEKLML